MVGVVGVEERGGRIRYVRAEGQGRWVCQDRKLRKEGGGSAPGALVVLLFGLGVGGGGDRLPAAMAEWAATADWSTIRARA